jgi:hypothetical protein
MRLAFTQGGSANEAGVRVARQGGYHTPGTSRQRTRAA